MLICCHCRVQTEETLRGYLLLTFIAGIIVKRIQDKLKTTSYNPISMFMNLRNQKCKVYDDQGLLRRPQRRPMIVTNVSASNTMLRFLESVVKNIVGNYSLFRKGIYRINNRLGKGSRLEDSTGMLC